ncbi:MAG: VWA domain-containing protein, partial [Acidobacteria bacterium]|nr:VWA domain-containing protein [Acidobacteriota bacterium]
MTPRLATLTGWVAGLAIVAGAAGLSAQIFRVGTDVVSLNITVTEGETLIPGLEQARFSVYEDGVQQEIAYFSRTPQPIALSLLIDTSTSMEHKLAVAQEAAIGFARRLNPTDAAQIIDFDSRHEILQTFTADRVLLEQAIRRTQVGGSTSLYNAIYVALSELKRVRAATPDQLRRQAIVVLSDGEDTSSLIAYEDVLESAKRSETAVYSIGLRSKQDRPTRGFNEAEFVLRSLSQETGGRVFFVEDVAQLPGIYQQIADELANQYSIGYSSKNPKRDGAWRAIVVKVDRPNTGARTKRGYFAPTAPRAPQSTQST